MCPGLWLWTWLFLCFPLSVDPITGDGHSLDLHHWCALLALILCTPSTLFLKGKEKKNQSICFHGIYRIFILHIRQFNFAEVAAMLSRTTEIECVVQHCIPKLADGVYTKEEKNPAHSMRDFPWVLPLFQAKSMIICKYLPSSVYFLVCEEIKPWVLVGLN